MKRKLIMRGLLGIPMGIALGYVITILISATLAQGYYVAVRPELEEMMGNELNAVIVQTLLCGVMGAGFAMATIIWEMDKWSIAKQSGIYFMVSSAIMLPIAYWANWMQHTIVGFLLYFAIFVGAFLIVWFLQYLGWRAKIKRLNESIQNEPSGK